MGFVDVIDFRMPLHFDEIDAEADIAPFDINHEEDISSL